MQSVPTCKMIQPSDWTASGKRARVSLNAWSSCFPKRLPDSLLDLRRHEIFRSHGLRTARRCRITGEFFRASFSRTTWRHWFIRIFDWKQPPQESNGPPKAPEEPTGIACVA